MPVEKYAEILASESLKLSYFLPNPGGTMILFSLSFIHFSKTYLLLISLITSLPYQLSKYHVLILFLILALVRFKL
jgi:hypothetical protein